MASHVTDNAPDTQQPATGEPIAEASTDAAASDITPDIAPDSTQAIAQEEIDALHERVKSVSERLRALANAYNHLLHAETQRRLDFRASRIEDLEAWRASVTARLDRERIERRLVGTALLLLGIVITTLVFVS